MSNWRPGSRTRAVALISFSIAIVRPAAAADPCIQPGTSALWNDFVTAKQSFTEPFLPDFSYAGYRRSDAPIPDVVGPIFDVTAFGAAPDDAMYDDAAIQATINAAGAAGGGVVFFPAGRYLVSPSETEPMTIRISSSRVVLRGAGAGDGGTEIVMVHKRQGKTMFIVEGSSFNAGTVANVVENSVRENFWLTVDDTSRLSVGQWVILRHSSTEYSPHYWWPLSLNPNWVRVWNNGTGVHEVHQVAEIRDNKVRFHEPVHFNVVLGGTAWRLEAIRPLEEVGIEDIRFTGKWDEYPEAFVHHKDWIHDSGWTMLSVRRAVNSWVRRCEFRHLNNAIGSDTASFITFEDIKFTGKKGHTSISHRRGNGVLVKDSEDTAPFHHGPGTGYGSVNVVYLRHKMGPGQAVDNHGGVPHATLLDDVTGGGLRGNGGPYDNYPHHGKYYVLWNFVHNASGNYSYDFWDTVKRDSHTFALPIFSGFTGSPNITFQDPATEVGANESFGTRVTPTSLFEAQLQFRQCSGTPPPPPPTPGPLPTATPYPTLTPTPTPTATPTPTPGAMGPNLAQGKPASASTIWSGSYNAPKAFDGSDSSRWSASSTAATDQWLAVDLLVPTAYNCVVMKEINYKRVTAHVLQMSDDGVTWLDIPETAAGAIGAAKTTCFDTVTSRYFRLFMNEARAGGALKEPTINEVAVYFQDRPPVITVPETLTVEATGPAGAVATFVATAADEKDGEVAVTLSPASGSTFPLGTTVVTATATDSAGNIATETFEIIVEDTTPPVLALPADFAVEATSAAGAMATFTATAEDLVSGSVPVTLAPPSGSTLPLGVNTVAASASDAAGNVATGSFVVAVIDTTAPVLTVPADVTITTCAAPSIGEATATDAVGVTAITNDAPAIFPLGTTVVTWRAVDAAGNATTATQRVSAELGDNASCCPAGTNVIVGTSVTNVLNGTAGKDCILGRGGDDVINALGGNDFISGGDGRDTIAAGPGDDLVMGGPGSDTIDASLGDDRVDAGAGIDIIAAGPGSDTVDGGTEHDVCHVPADGKDVVRRCP
jgi:hypothetical protein